jgi:hypothetical protein
MVASSVTIFGMVALGLTIPDAFLILAIANLIFVFLLRKLSSNT